MGPRPSKDYSIDRIDVDGDYCPENCKWANRKEQGRNKRTTLKLTYKGETKPLAEWAEMLGLKYATVYRRYLAGQSADDILAPLQRIVIYQNKDNMAEQTTELALHKPDRTSTDLAVFSSIEGFETGQRMAAALSASNIVPQNFQGKQNLGSCLIALDLAARMGVNPLVLMRGLYVVHGTPSFSGQFVIALVNSSGLYKSKLKFESVGTPGQADFGYRAYAYDWDGDKIYGPAVTMQMASSEGWIIKNSKWKSMPEMMLRYRCGAFFQRTNCPELTFGIPTREEVEDTEGVIDVPFNEAVEINPDEIPVAEPQQIKAPAPEAKPLDPNVQDF